MCVFTHLAARRCLKQGFWGDPMPVHNRLHTIQEAQYAAQCRLLSCSRCSHQTGRLSCSEHLCLQRSLYSGANLIFEHRVRQCNGSLSLVCRKSATNVTAEISWRSVCSHWNHFNLLKRYYWTCNRWCPLLRRETSLGKMLIVSDLIQIVFFQRQ